MPHLAVKRLSSINWKQLRAAGLKGRGFALRSKSENVSGCVFDKDNTLTRPFELTVHKDVVTSLMACKEAFEGCVVLFSNTAGLTQYDPKGIDPTRLQRLAKPAGKEADHLEETLGIRVLRHEEKKPSGRVQELEAFFEWILFSLETMQCVLVVKAKIWS